MEDIFETAPLRQFHKGQILIYEGDPIEHIFYILSGYVKVSNILSNGSQRTIIIYTPGEAFPLPSFLADQGVAIYFYECLTDVRLKSLPQAEFQQIIRGNFAMGEELIAYAYGINEQFAERIATLSASSSKLKIVSLLTYLANVAGQKSPSKTKINVPLTTQEIADMCGLTRETVTLQLLKLKKEGVVSGRRFLTIDNGKLKKLAAL